MLLAKHFGILSDTQSMMTQSAKNQSGNSTTSTLSRRRLMGAVAAFALAGASLVGAFVAPSADAETETPPTTAPIEAPAAEIPPIETPAVPGVEPVVEAPIDIAPIATPIETDVPVIVRLATDATANTLAGELAVAGGDITNEYEKVFPGFSADLSSSQIDWLVTQPGVVAVEADPTIFALEAQGVNLNSTSSNSGSNNLALWLLIVAGIAAVTGVVLVGAGRRKGVIAIASLAFIAAACGPKPTPTPPPTTTAPTTAPTTTTTTTAPPAGPAQTCRALGSWNTNLWGIDRVDQIGPWGVNTGQTNCLTSSGTGVDAYIFDTGIRCSHNQFEGRAVCDPQFDEISGHTSSVDCHGHGTHTAGTVGGKDYGVAPGVTLYAVRVLSCSGSGSTSGIVAAADSVIAHHTTRSAVANFSLGGGASSFLDSAIEALVADGISVSVSAGNSNSDACFQSPARATNAITVGSTTIMDARSSFSSWGTCVDIMAPGSSILSANYTSDTASKSMSGTSMSSPHVAGCAARYLAKFPGSTPGQVTAGLTNAATANALTDIPAGTPNKLLYCNPGW